MWTYEQKFENLSMLQIDETFWLSPKYVQHVEFITEFIKPGDDWRLILSTDKRIYHVIKEFQAAWLKLFNISV